MCVRAWHTYNACEGHGSKNTGHEARVGLERVRMCFECALLRVSAGVRMSDHPTNGCATVGATGTHLCVLACAYA